MLKETQLGKIFTLDQFLQQEEIYNTFLAIIYNHIDKSIPLHKMHEFLNGKEIISINDKVAQEIKSSCRKFVFNFVTKHLQVSEEFFIDDNPVIRFFTPYDYWKEQISPINKNKDFSQYKVHTKIRDLDMLQKV
jgi:hypothetical protein